MMEEFYPKAVYLPGPQNKQGYGPTRVRTGKGSLCHSAEGELPGILARLDSTAEVSWQFTVLYYSSVVLQHYPLSACCWHGGSWYVNTRWAGIEFEGRAGEALTAQQVAAAIDLLTWQAVQEGWGEIAHYKYSTLQEHNWFYPTACPSGRIPFDTIIGGIVANLTTKEEFEAYKAAVGLQQFGRDLRDGLIADLVAGKFHVGMKPNYKRVLILPNAAEVLID